MGVPDVYGWPSMVAVTVSPVLWSMAVMVIDGTVLKREIGSGSGASPAVRVMTGAVLSTSTLVSLVPALPTLSTARAAMTCGPSAVMGVSGVYGWPSAVAVTAATPER